MKPHFNHNNPPGWWRIVGGGFTLLEVVSVVAVVSVIAGVGTVAGSKIMGASKSAKLESDVATVNSAVKLYLLSGGSLDGVTQPEDVLDTLKTTRSASDARQFAGAPASSMIDRRITSVMQVGNEAESGELRAVWDGAGKRFVITDNGAPGVKEFAINEEWAERSITTETRAGSAMAFASSPDGTWIWDTGSWAAVRGGLAATGATTHPGATPESVTVDLEPEPDPTSDDDGGDEDAGGGGPSDPPLPPRLPLPNFDPVPGTFPLAQFPIQVAITDLADPAYGDVYYKVGEDTNWTLWAGVAVPVSSGQYLYAKALTKDLEVYLDSSTRSGKYVGLVETFSGSSGGLWTSPEGGANLVSEITNGADVSEFSHGDTRLDLGGEILDAGVQNRIRYEPKQIGGVAPNQRFEMGTLLMHNGTTFNDSEASTVNLQISIDLRENGGMQSFGIPFALENTENSDDRDASADIIQLLSTNTPVSPVIGGVRYNLVLSIGIADDNGFTQGAKFLVYEGATATGKIYGKFVPSY